MGVYGVPVVELLALTSPLQFAELYASLPEDQRPLSINVSGLSIEALGERIDSLVADAMAQETRRSATQTLWS